MKTINLTEVAASLNKKRGVHHEGAGEESPQKADALHEPVRKEVMNLSFSKDNKYIAFVISD